VPQHIYNPGVGGGSVPTTPSGLPGAPIADKRLTQLGNGNVPIANIPRQQDMKTKPEIDGDTPAPYLQVNPNCRKASCHLQRTHIRTQRRRIRCHDNLVINQCVEWLPLPPRQGSAGPSVAHLNLHLCTLKLAEVTAIVGGCVRLESFHLMTTKDLTYGQIELYGKADEEPGLIRGLPRAPRSLTAEAVARLPVPGHRGLLPHRDETPVIKR